MKKILLFFCLIFVANSIIAENDPSFNWGAYIQVNGTTTSTTSTPTSIRKNAQDELFAFGTFGTHTDKGTQASYKYVADENTSEYFTPEGAPYAGSSSNNNLFLYKLDTDGQLLWQVTSNMGDIRSSNSAMIPTLDGGAFLALKVRHTNRNENNNNILLGIVDKDNTQTNIEWEYPGFWAYQGIFIKISSAGKVEWTKKISVSTDIRDNFEVPASKTAITDGFAFNDLAIDESGYLYLAGAYINEITFDGPKTLVPHNGDGWGGDTQYPQNDLFLVKLTPAGEYVWDLVTTGTVKNETASSISYDNGYLYMLGNLQGDDTKTTYLGSYSATPTAKTDAYNAKIKAEDGSVEWLKHFSALAKDGKGGRIKIVSTQYSNGLLLTSGSFTGSIADADRTPIETNTNGTMLQGFVIKQDSQTGEVKSIGMAPTGGISEFSRSFYIDEKIHSVGYNMAKGQYYINFDANLTNADTPFIVMKATTSPTSSDACFINNRLISFGRGRSTISFTGVSHTNSFSAFSSILSCYTISSIGENPLDLINQPQENNTIVYANNGIINAGFKGVAKISLLSINGQLIDNTFADGNYSKPVPNGIYILRINNVSYKVLVK